MSDPWSPPKSAPPPLEDPSALRHPWIRLFLVMAVPILLLLVGRSFTR